MKVTLYGTRGSLPVAGPAYAKHGGRTTCLRLESDCLPKGHCLSIDAGSGIYPLGLDAIKEGVTEVTILFTHYHPDHTDGLPLSPITFNPNVKINCIGPLEMGIGPEAMLRDRMKSPYFPVDFIKVGHRFNCEGLRNPSTKVIVFHPEAGMRLIDIDKLRIAEQKAVAQIQINGGSYNINDCLIIKMIWSNHPERTISYRFEERPTGKIFVFLTDHENTEDVPAEMLGHLKGADLLVMDSQYSSQKYRLCAGFGHGTPSYCVYVASRANIPRLGLTHHDMMSTDDKIEELVSVAKQYAWEVAQYGGDIFACADDMVIEI
ncbi:MAG: MBL fold metallo-hydrolase [Candidatus Berkelbacteria bacterium]|nr:MBL fold metallo-hydrolase [Candidatus Berkelbacteria bacterium]